MYPSAERVQAARNAAVKAGVWKTALGVVVGVVVSAAQGFVLVAVHAPAFLAVLAVALFFVWGCYLVYVFGKDKAKQLEGATIRALWNAAYPTDAYAVAGP